jgi:hypothetical protein
MHGQTPTLYVHILVMAGSTKVLSDSFFFDCPLPPQDVSCGAQTHLAAACPRTRAQQPRVVKEDTKVLLVSNLQVKFGICVRPSSADCTAVINYSQFCR